MSTNTSDQNGFSRRDFLRLTFSLAVGTLLVPTDLVEAKRKSKTVEEVSESPDVITSLNDVGKKTKKMRTTSQIEAAPKPTQVGVLQGTQFKILDPNLTFRSQLQTRRRTDGIILHHIGGSDKEVSAATVHQWHLRNGWHGIGYHFMVHKDGTIERGRPLNKTGAHCSGENDHTIGVNIVGNFQYARPTAEQILAAEILLSNLCTMYRLQPGMTTIFGHRDFNRTECPGGNFYSVIPELIDRTKVRIEQYKEINEKLRDGK